MQSAIKEHQKLLAQQYKNKTLPHAILLSGLQGVGKNILSTWLIKLILCKTPSENNAEGILSACGGCKNCKLYQSGSYPDHFTVLPKLKTLSLGVDEVRLANEFLQKKAHLGMFQSVLVDNAHVMTEPASNALLKTLEEPSSNSVIILTTHEIELLLPTIISRCRVLHLKGLVGENLIASLASGYASHHSMQSKHNQTNVFETDPLNETPYLNSSHMAELSDEMQYDAYENFKVSLLKFLATARVEHDLLVHFNENINAYAWLEKTIVNLSRLRQTQCNENAYVNRDIQLKSLPQSEMLNEIYKKVTGRSKLTKNYIQANQQFLIEKLIIEISHLLKDSILSK
jgi:DNA polymerase-3 subunit delta'